MVFRLAAGAGRHVFEDASDAAQFERFAIFHEFLRPRYSSKPLTFRCASNTARGVWKKVHTLLKEAEKLQREGERGKFSVNAVLRTGGDGGEMFWY